MRWKGGPATALAAPPVPGVDQRPEVPFAQRLPAVDGLEEEHLLLDVGVRFMSWAIRARSTHSMALFL